MKSFGLFLLLPFAYVQLANGSDEDANPISKVIQLLNDLEGKLIAIGREDQKAYDEYATYCEATSMSLKHEIKVAGQTSAELKADIDKALSDIEVAREEIDTEAGTLSDLEDDLSAAKKLRDHEHKIFKEDERVVMTTKDTVERAIAVIERRTEGASGAASLAQLSGIKDVVSAFTAMAEATGLESDDSSELTVLLQKAGAKSHEDDDDDEDDQLKAPDEAANAYSSKSGQILETLNGLLDKVENQLMKVRKNEMSLQNSYLIAKTSLDARIKGADEAKADAQKELAKATELKASASGDLTITEKDLIEDKENLKELHKTCIEKATSFQEEVVERGEELKSLGEAKKIIVERTGGAKEKMYGGSSSFGQLSFMQMKAKSSESSGVSQSTESLHIVRKLAREHRSGALNQLASRMEVMIRSAERGRFGTADPFDKVRTLIEDMIYKLTEEQRALATQKMFCDREMADGGKKEGTKKEDLAEITAAVETSSIKSKALQSEVAALQADVAAIQKQEAEISDMRTTENTAYQKNRPELEKGLAAVKQALKVLRSYYGVGEDGGGTSSGAADSIIGLLEVCESDFQKGLSEMKATEEAAQTEYQTVIRENMASLAVKNEDIKYKTKEITTLERMVAELSTDKEGLEEELNAVNSYMGQLKKQCMAKKDPYEVREKRRQEEIAGLKQAFDVLSGGGDYAFVQLHSVTHH